MYITLTEFFFLVLVAIFFFGVYSLMAINKKPEPKQDANDIISFDGVKENHILVDQILSKPPKGGADEMP